jgi:hypothetical protein
MSNLVLASCRDIACRGKGMDSKDRWQRHVIDVLEVLYTTENLSSDARYLIEIMLDGTDSTGKPTDAAHQWVRGVLKYYRETPKHGARAFSDLDEQG